MRGVEIFLCKTGRIGGNQWQVIAIGKRNQVWLGFPLNRVKPPRNLHIKPVGKQQAQAVGIVSRCLMLALREQPGQRAFGSCRQRNQAIGASAQRVERDMRLFVDRPAQMRRRNQPAKIIITDFILRIKRQPVIGRRRALWKVGSRNAQKCTDNRLYSRLCAAF